MPILEFHGGPRNAEMEEQRDAPPIIRYPTPVNPRLVSSHAAPVDSVMEFTYIEYRRVGRGQATGRIHYEFVA
jgi:hypothetical protein